MTFNGDNHACDQCGSDLYQLHFKLHEKIYVCFKCFKKFLVKHKLGTF